MADDYLETSLSEMGFKGLHGSESAAGPVGDQKLLLSGQDRAPSNSSNYVRNCIELNPPPSPTRDDCHGWIGAEQSYEESLHGQRPWIAVLPELEEDGGSYPFFRGTQRDACLDVEAIGSVRDRFRELESVNFFDEIIAVDREVGFGEDVEFARQQNGDSNDLYDILELRPICAKERGMEEHIVQGGGIDRQTLKNPVQSRLESVESARDKNGQLLRSRSVTDSVLGPGAVTHPSSGKSGLGGPPTEVDTEFEWYSECQDTQNVDSVVKLEETEGIERLAMKSLPRDDVMQLEQKPGKWVLKSRKVQTKEDVGMWQEKVWNKEQEGKCTQTRKDYPVDKNADNMDDVIRDMLVEIRQENRTPVKEEPLKKDSGRTSLVLTTGGKRNFNNKGNPYGLIIMAFEDLLKETGGRADSEKKRVEDAVESEEAEEVMRLQHTRSSETQRQLESRINSLEMQNVRLSDTLRETEAALTVEKERRKASRTEVDRILDILMKERKSHQETLEKVNMCVNSLMKLRGDAAMQKSSSPENGGSSYPQVLETVLYGMDRELQINLSHHLARKSFELDSHSSSINEFISRWKQERDALEAERDKVEENTSLVLRKTRERHGEMEALWLEREMLLEQKVECLEFELQNSQLKLKRKEAELFTVRERWAGELETCRQAWAHERALWEATLSAGQEIFSNQTPEVYEDNCLQELFKSDSEGKTKVGSPTMGLQDVESQGSALVSSKDLAFDKGICANVGNLVLGVMSERVSEGLGSREDQWEMERMEWNEVLESFKKGRQEMEKTVADTLSSLEELKIEMKSKDIQMDADKKQVKTLLMEKATEVEKLKEKLKFKEREMEMTVQKFMDEVRLIDKEVDKERKEREQVMELHFASKRKVVMDMKEREERWEEVLDSLNQELDNAKMDLESKDKEIEHLKRSSVDGTSEACQLVKAISSLQHENDTLVAELSKEKGMVRRNMEEILVDVWKLCCEEQIQARVAKRVCPDRELCLHRPMWESLWLEYCKFRGISDEKKSVEWEVALGEMTRFIQISEAMSAIEDLHNELKVKSGQSVQINAESERDRKFSDEQEQQIKILQSQLQNDRKLAQEWQEREQLLIREKEASEKLYKAEKDESVEAISNLQGIVRELEWILKRRKNSPTKEASHENATIIGNDSKQSLVKDTELVKVHTSYLEEVDRYIQELEAKMKASERSLGTPEEVLTRNRGRLFGGNAELNLALMKIEKELYNTPEENGLVDLNSLDDDRGYFSTQTSRDWDLSASVLMSSGKRRAHKRVSRSLEGSMCLTLNGLATMADDTWSQRADEHLPLSRLEGSNSVTSITSWISPRSSIEDLSYSAHELPSRALWASPTNSPPSTPFRNQRKWVVDARWLEQVRKEHAWLTQQLEIERQRVAALGRVEADSRWIEAIILRAIELKRESDTNVADLQSKMSAMEVLLSKSGAIGSNLSS